MIDKLKALNKKTIALIAVTAVVLVAGIVGAVTFLKDDGTTAATELQADGTYTGENLPVAGNDVAVDTTTENEEQPENPLTPDENADVAEDDAEDDATDATGDETTAGTGTGRPAVGTGTGETTYQEFVTEETYWVTEDGLRVGWSPIKINSKYSTFELGINKPGLKVTKTADKTENVKAGETVVYTIEVENIGQIAVKDVVLSDVLTKTPLEGDEISLNLDLYNLPDYDENGPTGEKVEKISVVEVGQKVQLFAFYKVTQDDIENEIVLTNSAIAENGPTKGEDDEPVNVEERSPILDVTKVANENVTEIENGKQITYTVTVENKGNVELTTTLTDTLILTKVDGTTEELNVTAELVDENGNKLENPIVLAVGDKKVYTYTYTDNAEDITVDSVTNKLSYDTETRKDDEKVTEPEKEPEVIVDIKNPEITVEKTVENEKDEYKLGDTITYVVTVSNTGEIDIENINVEDILKSNENNTLVDLGRTATLTEGTATIEKLIVGASATLKYTYTVVEADLGKTIVNTVVAKGGNTEGGDETPGENVEERKPSVDITKVAESATIENGQTVNYTVTVVNTGNVTVKVTLSDVITKLDKAGKTLGTVNPELKDKDTGAVLNGEISLEPGATKVYVYSYTDDNSETEVNKITNKITSNVITDIPDEDVKKPEDPEVEVKINNPSINVTKEVTSKGTGENGAYKLGETITYEVTVTNNGEIDLTGITVADVLKEKLDETLVDFVGKATTTDVETFDLVVGAEKVLTYTYKVTEADLGKILVNTVKATGTDTDGEDETPGENIEKENPGLTVTKVADKEKIDNGESVTYTVTLTNTGNTTIKTKVHDVLTKVNENGTETPVDVVLKDATGNEYNKDTEITLIPNVNPVLVLTYTYTDSAEDTTIDIVKNKVTATVTNKEYDPEDPEVIIEVNNPSVKVEKEVTSTGTGENGAYKLGEKITYEVTITNDGETVLENMVVADVLKEKDTNGNLTTLANQATLVSGNETIEKLAIEGSVKLTYEYTITEADLGKTLVNTVTTSGSNTEGGDETPGEKVEEKNPSLTVEKTVSKNGGEYAETVTVGYNDTVKYKMVITNNGNLTLNVTESDLLTTNKVDGTKPTTDVVVVNEDGTEFTSVELTPNGSVTLYYDYGIIDQDKVNTINTRDNTITVNGVNPADNTQTATDNDNATVTVLKPNITATKASSIMDGDKVVKSSPMTVKPGDVITYTITVTNNGDTNGNATVVDEIPAGVTLLGTPVVSDTTYTAMTVEGKTITVVATSMPANASFTITFTAQVDAINNDVAQTGLQIVNNVKVDGTINDTTTDTVSKPVITAVKTSEYTTTAVTTDSTSTTKNVHEGDTIVYTMTIKNLGLVKSEMLTFEDILPDGVEYVSSTGKVISWGTNASGSFENEVKDLSSTTSVNETGKTVVAWDSTELDRGQKAVLTVTVRVKALEAGVYSANITNNTVTVKQNSIPVVEGEDPKDYDVVKSNIAVSKAVKSEDETKDLNGVAVRTGTTVKYIITATNAGATEAETVTITDNLDTTALRNISATVSVNGGDATALDVTDGNISYTTTINPNDTVVIKITGTTRDLNAGETSYRINNTADYTYNGNSGSSNTVTTEAKHLLEISKTVTTPTLTNTAEYGDTISYTITATNLSGVSEPVTIVDTLSNDLSNITNIKVNGVENNSIYNSTTHTITYNGTLANLNDKVTITFDATVNTIEVGSVIENIAYVNDAPAEANDVKVVKEVKVTVDKITQNPLDVVVVLDRSGSMDNYSRATNAVKATKALVNILFPEAVDTGSTFSLITFSSTVSVNLKAKKGTDKQSILNTINSIDFDGGTYIYGGLNAANNLLASGDLKNTNKIVIFLSDGAPVTTTATNKAVDGILYQSANNNNTQGDNTTYAGNTRSEIEAMANNVKEKATVYSIGLAVNSTDMANNDRAWAELCNEVAGISYEVTSTMDSNHKYTFTVTAKNTSNQAITIDEVKYRISGAVESTISAEGATINNRYITWSNVTVPANGEVTGTITATANYDEGGIFGIGAGYETVTLTDYNNQDDDEGYFGTCTNQAHKVAPFTTKFSGTYTKNGKVYHYMTTYKFADYLLDYIAHTGKYYSNIKNSNVDQLTTVFEQIIRENVSGTQTYYTDTLPAVITIPETATIIGDITIGLDGETATYAKQQLTNGITKTGYTLTYTAGTGFTWTITSNDVLYKELTIQYAK